jgi:NUMOD3 motif-containing protein
MNVAKLKSQSTPYTYILEWTTQNKRYIGARWAAGCHPSDLWTEYFTSSKYVEKFVALYGPPDVILIDQTFDNALDAMTREQELQYKFNVRYNDDFLNKAVAGVWDHNDPEIIEKLSASRRGKKHTQEQKDKIGAAHKGRKILWADKISAAHKGKKLSPEHVEKMAASKRGVKQSAETIRKRSLKLIGNKSRTGQVNSEETRRKMSEAHRRHPERHIQETVSCDRCGKSGQRGAMIRWHFQNCKHQKIGG